MAGALRAILAAVVIAVGLFLALIPAADAVVPPLTQPTWNELTPQQREILAPLSGEWDRLEPNRRMKWLGIAQRYPTLKPDEQQRIQRRMKEWVSLTPEQRKAAREKYKSLRNAPPEHREAVKQKWQEYKELPEDEKLRLQAAAAKRKIHPKSAASRPKTPSKTLSGTATSGRPAAANVPPTAPLLAAPAGTPAAARPASATATTAR